MAETVNLKQTLLKTVRSLPPSQQEAVLNFARSLSRDISAAALPLAELPPLKSLQQIAKLPIRDRNQLLATYVAAMAKDFETDPELTEYESNA